MPQTNRPLEGVKILDLSRLLPGPFCTQLLADLGADIVKVESPDGGDYMRNMPPRVNEQGAYFLAVNAGKRSITVDLRSPAGPNALRALLETFDVLLEGFRPGVLTRFGLGHEQLQSEFPRLIYASLSGFGQTGPLRRKPGHDVNYLALTGGLSITGNADGELVIPGHQIADVSGALYTAVALLAAVIRRDKIGRGSYVDVALADSALALMAMTYAEYFQSQTPPTPAGHPVTGLHVCYHLYRTSDDRHMALGALEPKFWQAFCEAVGRTDLIAEGYTPARRGNPVYETVCEIFAGKTQAEWVRELGEVDCCCEPVLNLAETAHHPHFTGRGCFQETEHPTGGTYQRLKSPLRFDPPAHPADGPAPALGAHTKAVYAEAGVTAEKFEEYRQAGAFGPLTDETT
ncbi:MAG: CaiB/BaiF CoA-transferase family protein [Candidatus Lernaella stagnicola]|nr:CaiB/BaiF CoA-transferase family protein [Candidatus Lernaella stagnicola]